MWEVWQTSNLQPLRIGEEKRKEGRNHSGKTKWPAHYYVWAATVIDWLIVKI